MEETSHIVAVTCTVSNEAEENQCCICLENLEQFFDKEHEEWRLHNGVRVDGKTYHNHYCYLDKVVSVNALQCIQRSILLLDVYHDLWVYSYNFNIPKVSGALKIAL